MLQRSDSLWCVGTLAALVLFSIFGLPYFSQLGHPFWSLLVYGFIAVIFLYGRNNRPTRKHKGDAGFDGKEDHVRVLHDRVK